MLAEQKVNTCSDYLIHVISISISLLQLKLLQYKNITSLHFDKKTQQTIIIYSRTAIFSLLFKISLISYNIKSVKTDFIENDVTSNN